jgi:hypothetical protein
MTMMIMYVDAWIYNPGQICGAALHIYTRTQKYNHQTAVCNFMFHTGLNYFEIYLKLDNIYRSGT